MPTVSYPGIQGAFSHQAALNLFPDGILYAFEDWEKAALAVFNGECDYGVFPLSNTLAGDVPFTYALLEKYKLKTIKEYALPIRQHLLSVAETTLSDIRFIHSHSHAIGQCQPYLEAHPNWEIILSPSTAISAQWVARQGDKAYAAIASLEAAQAYGLTLLQKDIHSGHNETCFGVVVREGFL